MDSRFLYFSEQMYCSVSYITRIKHIYQDIKAPDIKAKSPPITGDITWYVRHKSSRSAVLPPLSPLRTVRDSFPSYGSSILSLFRATVKLVLE